MDLDQTIRDFLSGLVEDNSPETWLDKDFLIKGIINSKYREIAFLYTLKLEIKGPLDYEILEDEAYDYSLEDFKKNRIKYITDKEYKLERQEEEEHEDRMIEDINVLPSTRSIQKSNLFNDLVNRKRLTNYSVFGNTVLYGTTYKIELYISRDYSALPIEELRQKYIDTHIRKHIDEIELEIRKYPEQQHRNPYLTTIKLFRNKLLLKSREITDQNVSLCYNSIYDRLNDLLQNIKDYFPDDQPKVQKKLEWHRTIGYFKIFVNGLIDKKKIELNGKADKFEIYTKLLQHFTFPKEGGIITVKDILGPDLYQDSVDGSKLITSKIEYKRNGLPAFCREFKNIIIPGKPGESIILLNGSLNLAGIARKMYMLFLVRIERNPHTTVKMNSFVEQFPKHLKRIQSDKNSD